MWDVVIIGAGVVGCAVARELSQFSIKAIVLEKGPDICAGASKGNSAVVHAGFDPEPGSNKAIFNVAGNRMYDALCEELDVPFSRNGMIVFACSSDQMEEVAKLKRNGDANSVPVEVLDAQGLKAIEPDIGPDVIGGLWAPTSGMVCPYSLVFAMAENAAVNGVTFRTMAQVTAIEKKSGSWNVTVNDGEVITGRVIVNCAGAHAGTMNNMASSHVITIIPRQGEHILLDRKYGKYVNTTISQTPTALPGGGHTKGMAIMPTMEGTVLLGANAVEVEQPDDCRATAGGLQSIIKFFEANWQHLPIARSVPQFPRDGVIATFSAVRAHSVTNDFIIGPAPDADTFFNAAGIESPGIAAGPAIGRHLAQMIAEKLSPERNADYQPRRQASKPFRTMSGEERMEAIKADPNYARIVCRCELVTEAEIRHSIRRPLGARSVGGVKMRTRAGMGRCQGGFCSPRVMRILSEELQTPMERITLGGPGSEMVLRPVGDTSDKSGDK